MWAPNHQELVAGLGTPNNCASVWKYKHPSVKKIKDLRKYQKNNNIDLHVYWPEKDPKSKY